MKERRALEQRRGADARAERSYDNARRRLDALEKALSLIAGGMVPGTYQVDPTRTSEYRRGIDIARSLLGLRPGPAGVDDSAPGAPPQRSHSRATE